MATIWHTGYTCPVCGAPSVEAEIEFGFVTVSVNFSCGGSARVGQPDGEWFDEKCGAKPTEAAQSQ